MAKRRQRRDDAPSLLPTTVASSQYINDLALSDAASLNEMSVANLETLKVWTKALWRYYCYYKGFVG
jgi:hypothetical protein